MRGGKMSDIERVKKCLYLEVGKIKSLDIRKFVISALDEAPEGFWKDGSSSGGKYHPPEGNGENGIIRHVIKCIAIVEEFCFFMNLSEEERDVLIAAAILHDIRKHGEPWTEHTHPEHPKIAADCLGKFDLDEKIKERILNCVRYHYGNCTQTESDKSRAMNLTKEESILHMADVLSSRKHMSWLPGVCVSDAERDSFFDKYSNQEGIR